MKRWAQRERQSMRIRSAVEIEDPAAGAEPTNRERRIKAGYRRLLRAVLDGKQPNADCGVPVLRSGTAEGGKQKAVPDRSLPPNLVAWLATAR